MGPGDAVSRSATDVIATWLESRLSRRSLLGRGAVAATALVTHPIRYTLRPGTAYAALCSTHGLTCPCGSQCLEGYSQFCCTLNGGYNWCPENGVISGWWKADYSNFCDGARYYLDCNALCNCDTGCGDGYPFCDTGCDGENCECAEGNCDNWFTGCLQFRYGQCNQQVSCIGRIICRVVSCEPPWTVDSTCTTALAVDNATAEQNVACNTSIPQPPFGEDSMVFVICYDAPKGQPANWLITSDGFRIAAEDSAGSPESAEKYCYKTVTGVSWNALMLLPQRSAKHPM
jgi:hypothetical protein